MVSGDIIWLLLLFVHTFALAGFNLSLRKSLLKKADPFILATVMRTGIAIPAVVLLIVRLMTFGAYEPKRTHRAILYRLPVRAS